MMDWNLEGSIVMSVCETMNPKRRSTVTQKTYLRGFRWKLYLRQCVNMVRRSWRWSCCFLELDAKSFKKYRLISMRSLKMYAIAC